MLYFILGVIVGALVNLLPVLQPLGGFELYPQWIGSISSIGTIAASPDPEAAKGKLPAVVTAESIVKLRGDGAVLHRRDTPGKLVAASGSGAYYATFEKTGRDIEFFNIAGERFWKLQSQEYPYLTYNGGLVMLLVGDQSRLRIVDYNGNMRDDAVLTGRFCTIIASAPESDCAAAGFMDGKYYIIGKNGGVLTAGSVPELCIVKNIALSPDGAYAAVHFGDEKADSLMLLNTQKNKRHFAKLGRVHVTKTALSVTDDGTSAVIDYDRILLLTRKGKTARTFDIPPARDGASSITHTAGLYAAGYTRTTGEAQFLLFTDDGTVVYRKAFPEESFLDAKMSGNLILLRGSQNLYCYRYLFPEPRR